MKKGAPRKHLEKGPYPGGAQTLYLKTVSQFELFFLGPWALKKKPKGLQKVSKRNYVFCFLGT